MIKTPAAGSSGSVLWMEPPTDPNSFQGTLVSELSSSVTINNRSDGRPKDAVNPLSKTVALLSKTHVGIQIPATEWCTTSRDRSSHHSKDALSYGVPGNELLFVASP